MTIRFAVRALSTLIVATTVSALTAAAQARPSQGDGLDPSRFEVYAGYGYFSPKNSDIGNIKYEDIAIGGVTSIRGYFTRNLGLELEGSVFPHGDAPDNDCVYTAQAGPVARLNYRRFTPFVHALGGAAKIGGPARQTCDVWGWGVTGGLGLDIILPVFNNRFSIRPAQGDFMYSQIDNGKLVVPANQVGGFGEIYAYRLSAGVSLRLGGFHDYDGKAATSLSCTTQPASVIAGEPVTVTASAENFRMKSATRYLWSTSGGRINGTEATETVETAGLAPGTYNVSATLVQGSRDKPVANCMASFEVMNPAPPLVSCSADRAAVNSGTPVMITTVASSPSGRPLTYAYTATNGQVAGDGATATLQTIGATPGTITVNCMVMDDKGKQATAHASVVIATPAPPPAAVVAAAQASDLCSLSFERDRRRPDRVDNAAKACLDDIALALGRDPSARIVLVGNHGDGETNRNSAERALNASDYLTQEKGIDASRINLRIAAGSSRSVQTVLLPGGAREDSVPGQSFDTSTVVRRGQAYGKPGQSTRTYKRKTKRKATTRKVAPNSAF